MVYRLCKTLASPAAQIGCAEAAAQAVFAVAVMLAQTDKGLAVGGMFHGNAGALPTAGNVVAFGGQGFEQGKGAFGHVFVHQVSAVGKEQRCGGVDDEQVERGGLQCFCAKGAFFAKGVMLLPVGGGADAEKLTEGFDVGAFKQARKVGAAFYIELHKLRQPDVGKILGPQTAKLPRIADEGLQAELVTQKGVFVLQPGKVVVDAVGGKGLGVEQSGLSHEEGFDLKGIIAVLANGLGVDGQGPLFKGLCVGSEAKVSGKGYEEHAFPVAIGEAEVTLNALCFFFESFNGEAVHPGMYMKGLKVWNDAITGGIGFFVGEFVIIVQNVFGHFHADLRQCFSVGGLHFAVYLSDDVEYHVVVGGIGFVVMPVPVGGAFVYFDIACPYHSFDA